jgi:hypothetical protein
MARTMAGSAKAWWLIGDSLQELEDWLARRNGTGVAGAPS